MTVRERLEGRDWVALIRTVFAPGPGDRRLGLLCDLPDEAAPDHDAWRERRGIVLEWLETLRGVRAELGLESVEAVFYRNVRSNNADLPPTAYRFPDRPPPPESLDAARAERDGSAVPMEEVLASTGILLAVTEFSATAPLKLLARRHRYRAATMPGFSRAMIPALGIDFAEVSRRLELVRERLDRAEAAIARFEVTGVGRGGGGGGGGPAEAEVFFDLRHRSATVSSGILREPGTAGNLPSGETYIVPYEGERGEASRTEGILPVQFGREVVRYRLEANRAREVLGGGPAAARERGLLGREPAYGNVSELGFGILRDLGVRPSGSILLDEKLGFHVAFGRSDHFGGAVGASDFRDPDNVVHVDRIYIPECQDLVRVAFVRLRDPDGSEDLLMDGGRYTLFG